jgi:hypothetical protein
MSGLWYRPVLCVCVCASFFCSDNTSGRMSRTRYEGRDIWRHVTFTAFNFQQYIMLTLRPFKLMYESGAKVTLCNIKSSNRPRSELILNMYSVRISTREPAFIAEDFRCFPYRCSNELGGGRPGFDSRQGQENFPYTTASGTHPASCQMGTCDFFNWG